MIKNLLQTILKRFRRLQPGRASDLPIEVSGCLPALELLGKHMVSVAQKGNTSTEELSQSFAEMAARANELVAQVTNGPQDESGVEGVQQVLQLLLSKFQESNQATSTTGQTLSQIEGELERVEACASEVEDIARRARLVSLNGRIEAQRAGEHGAGFAIVAEETGKLALTVAKTSQEIGEAVARLTGTLRATSAEMHALVDHGNAAAEDCERNVNQTLDQLMAYQARLEQNLDSARATGDSLSSSISRSIIGLQFQDAASQRIHHVSNSLQEIRDHIAEMVPTNRATETRSQWWLDKIAENYCVDDEHQVHTGGSQTADSSIQSFDDMSNVELF